MIIWDLLFVKVALLSYIYILTQSGAYTLLLHKTYIVVVTVMTVFYKCTNYVLYFIIFRLQKGRYLHARIETL